MYKRQEYVLGSVEFEDAFTGWVYIPWDTFYADNFTLDVNTHTMARITAVPQKLGNDASHLTFGPLYLEMEDGGKLSQMCIRDRVLRSLLQQPLRETKRPAYPPVPLRPL